MSPIKTIERGNKVLEIFVDENSESPREWSNLGIMACAHKNYNLGDKQIKSQEEYDEELKDAVVALPLFLYDHSSLTLSTSGFEEIDPQRWDWGQLGVIYTTKEKIREMYGNRTPKESDIKEILKQEVSVYNQYINNDVYGYTLYETKTCSLGETHKELIDSCGGFYTIQEILDQHPEMKEEPSMVV